MTVDPSDEAPYGGCYYDNSGLYGAAIPSVPDVTYTFTAAPLTGTVTNVVPDPLNMGIVNNPSAGINTVTTTGIPMGQIFYNPASETIFVYDGNNWNPLTPPSAVELKTEPCADYKGRKARKCSTCGYKYLDHSEGQYALLRDRLLAMQQKVREL